MNNINVVILIIIIITLVLWSMFLSFNLRKEKIRSNNLLRENNNLISEAIKLERKNINNIEFSYLNGDIVRNTDIIIKTIGKNTKYYIKETRGTKKLVEVFPL